MISQCVPLVEQLTQLVTALTHSVGKQWLHGMSMCVPGCRYAVEQLTWLVTQLASSGNPAFLAQLQKNIELCDQKSGSNSSVPRDEDVKAFADIIDIAQVQLAACCAAPATRGMQGRVQRHMGRRQATSTFSDNALCAALVCMCRH